MKMPNSENLRSVPVSTMFYKVHHRCHSVDTGEQWRTDKEWWIFFSKFSSWSSQMCKFMGLTISSKEFANCLRATKGPNWC